MGIINKLTVHKILTIFLAIFLFASCENLSREGGSNCIDCNPAEPAMGDISIDFTINNVNDSVPLYIYYQKYNDNILPDTIVIATSTPYILKVKTNRDYSVKAIYKSGSKTINSIDGGVFNAQEQSSCNVTCWQLVGGKYDVKLKFD
jgi:hypothetical protein